MFFIKICGRIFCMIFKKIAFFMIFSISLLAFSEEPKTQNKTDEEEENPLSLTLKIDSIYYLKSAYQSGDSHFSPLSSAYDGIVARTSINAAYKIKTPLGTHFLLKDANAILGAGLELSPVSLRALSSVYFTPLPFLELGAGGSAGTGWEIWGKYNGMAQFDFSKIDYKKMRPFRDWHFDAWAQATFQMDSGTLIEGDWTHVLFLATAKIFYERLTGAYNSLWEWQATKHYTNGLQHYQSLLLGYQLPLKLKIAGVMAEWTGHFDSNDYGKIANTYDGDFSAISISPFVRVQFTKKDRLDALFRISSRRSFLENHDDEKIEPTLTKSGREWFFDQFVFSFSHQF